MSDSPSAAACSAPVVAVVGATGLVGRTMIQVLTERAFPMRELRAFASARSAGTTLTVGDVTVAVGEARPEAFDGVDIALFSAGGSVSKRLAPEAAARDCVVIDNSSAWRMEPDIPLVVADVNDDDAALHEGIIANPNCSTMQLMPLFKALRDSVGLERAIVDTYQAVGGTGEKAIREFQAQIEAHVDGRPMESAVYPHPIAFNALPEIDVFLDNGYSKEEWKVVTESRKILHLPGLPVSCTAVRVPVFVGHSEAVHVETRDPITPEQARALFAGVGGVIVVDEPAAHRYPLATVAAGTDEVYVGRLRADASRSDGRGLAFWVVADNLRKGAATNAIQIAELLVRNGWVAKASRRARFAASAGAASGARG